MVVFYNCIAVLGKGILIKQYLFTFSENSRTESFGVCWVPWNFSQLKFFDTKRTVEFRVMEIATLVVPWNIRYRVRLVPRSSDQKRTFLFTANNYFLRMRSDCSTWKLLRAQLTPLYSANLGEYAKLRALIRGVSMACPKVGFSLPRKKSESGKIRCLTRGGHVACHEARYLRTCPYSQRIRVRIVWFPDHDTRCFTQCCEAE